MGYFSLSNLLAEIEMNGLGESFLLPTILNMSITASVIILFVLLARLLLKNAPKIYSYALWAVVLFRLLCPVSFTTDFSLLRLFDTPVVETTEHAAAMEYVPYDIVHTRDLEVHLPVVPVINEAVNSALPQEHAALGADPLEGEMGIASAIWLLGIAAMAVYSAASYIRLRRRLIGAMPLRENIYLADHIGSPFVMGLLRPKIYLPSSLPEQEQEYILLHEQHHIRRLDHVVKALAFLALCIHWFNPLVWIAFVLSSKDMEMSCDEAVVKKLGEGIRADYSASLLSLATGRRIIAGTPLAFGEGDTGSRIKNMLRWKKPRIWITIAAALVCITVAAACLGNPSPQKTPEDVNEPPQSTPVQTLPTDSALWIQQGDYGTPGDMAHYMELAADGPFRDMSAGRKSELLAEYGDLLEGYTLLARESTDGKSAAYIIGRFDGDPAESPLHGMYSIELGFGEEDSYEFLYHEDDSETVETILASNKQDFPPSVGHRIENSRLFRSSDSGLLMIQPKETEVPLDVAWNRYLYTPNGREYIADAVRRGIDVCGRTDTFLYIYRLSETYGEIAERIALSEAEAQAILAEEGVKITDGFGFSATLHTGGETTYYNEHDSIPQTILDLAVERCDYRFGDPSYITDTIREARLDCDWIAEPLYADTADLARLREILKGAEHGYVGACGYGAKLTLTFTGGEKLTVFKGTDGCDTIVFGSYGGYFLGDKENLEFWEIFGLDPDTKEPRRTDSAHVLTQEELEQFNAWFAPIVQNPQGNSVTNPLSCFFTSYYADVRELDFSEFMCYFPGDGSRTSDAEFALLLKQPAFPFRGEVSSLTDMPVPVHKYPRQAVDQILQEYAGISTAALTGTVTDGALLYLEEYDAYYNFTSDFGPGTFTCSRGIATGDIIRLYDEASPHGTDALTLRRTADGSYHIVSHLPADSAVR